MSASNPIKSFIKSRFPRAVGAYHNACKALTGHSLATIFSEIYHTNAWKDAETVSGRGSRLERTRVIISQLPLLLQEVHAENLLDAACGDFNWMRHTELDGVMYIGVDVVPDLISRNRSLYEGPRKKFVVLDITKDPLPNADLILCRDCLIHLSYASIRAAIDNFRKTGATYLACTTHSKISENIDCTDGSWRNINLELPPFNLPRPLKLIVEDEEAGKCLGLWRLADLNYMKVIN